MFGRDDSRLPGRPASTPATLTIFYSDRDVHGVIDEAALELWWWDGVTWQPATSSCPDAAPVVGDTARNMIELPVCRSGRFTLVGATHSRVLPIVQR